LLHIGAQLGADYARPSLPVATFTQDVLSALFDKDLKPFPGIDLEKIESGGKKCLQLPKTYRVSKYFGWHATRLEVSLI
jgi:hypothetical protein